MHPTTSVPQVGQKDTLYAAQNTRGLLFFEG